jgi:hypothetical protein
MIKKICYLCKKEIKDSNNHTIIGGLDAHKECKPLPKFKENVGDGEVSKAGEQARKFNEQKERRIKSSNEFRLNAQPSLIPTEAVGADNKHVEPIATEPIIANSDTDSDE